MAAMIFKLPPQFGQWSMSKTRLSSLAQLQARRRFGHREANGYSGSGAFPVVTCESPLISF